MAEYNMKLKKLQQERIEQIIREEIASLNEGWNQVETYKRSSKLNERNLFEAGAPIEQDLTPDKVIGAVESVSSELSSDCLAKFDDELLSHIASILQSHGLIGTGGSDSVYQILVDFPGGENEMIDAQMECKTDIMLALDNYVRAISILAVNAVKPGQ